VEKGKAFLRRGARAGDALDEQQLVDGVAQAGREAALASLAEPTDIAHAVLFLLSDGARAITGEVLRVDAGQYI